MKISRLGFSLYALLGVALNSPAFAQGSTHLVSIDPYGGAANLFSYQPKFSADGKHIVFWSTATNLQPGLYDPNGQPDVFVRHLSTGLIEAISLDSMGTTAMGSSSMGSISETGTWIAFESTASNLVALDSNGQKDIFVRDLSSATTELISVTSGGVQANSTSFHASISGDGRYVVFQSWASNLVSNDLNGWQDVFLHDRQLGTTICLSVDASGVPGNGFSTDAQISTDGFFIAFTSSSNNLVAGDTNGLPDVFVYDLVLGTLELGSRDSNGVQASASSGAPSLSADGRFLAFESFATNLVGGDTNNFSDVFLRDRQTGITERISISSSGAQGLGNSFAPSVSADGNRIAFRSVAENLAFNDTNLVSDVLIHDRSSGATELVSISSLGLQARWGNEHPSISNDGSLVAFQAIDGFVSADSDGTEDIYFHEVDVNRNAINLTGPVIKSAGSFATYSWSDAPSNSPYAFLSSDTNNGSVLQGHDFEIGDQ
ncbi:MAG: hypothetical protein QM477_11230 [Planctomycetota bacterium]